MNCEISHSHTKWKNMMLENYASVHMWVCVKETLHGGSRHVTFKGNIYPAMPTLYKCYIAIYADFPH